MKEKKDRNYYAELMEKYLPELGLAPDEEIKQCVPPYPEYWFVTNQARVFSMYNVKRCTTPLKPYNKSSSGKMKRRKIDTPLGSVYLSRVVADHFCGSEIAQLFPGEPLEVHHINPNAPNVDSADNLQWLPKSIHEKATNTQRHPTQEKMDAYYQRQIRAAHFRREIKCNMSQFEEIISQLVQHGTVIVYRLKKNGSCKVEVVPPAEAKNEGENR